MSHAEIINHFLGAIFEGRMDDALALVDEKAVFISTRPQTNPNNPMHGTYIGPEGATQFFSGFAETLEPGTFDVEHQHEKDDHVVMYGKLEHTVKSTGKKFASDWSLICKIDQGKITLYHFYEDTEALYFAMQK